MIIRNHSIASLKGSQAHSLVHRPRYSEKVSRPVRAKALTQPNAFALTGRVFKTDNLSATKKDSGKNDVCIVFIRLRTLKSDKNSLVLDANLGATKKYDFKNSVYIVYQCFRALKSHKKRSRFES